MSLPRASLPTSFAGSSAANGIELSRLAYGVWRLGEDPKGAEPDRVLEKVDACLELGITTFDHADIYRGHACEEAFGRALKSRSGLRDQLEIVTKCNICLVDEGRPSQEVRHYETSAEHLRASVESSLRKLDTDRVDLLLLHRPDPLMDAAETGRVLSELHREGKVLAFGVSNFTPRQADLLRMRLELPIVANQIELSPLAVTSLRDGTLDHCQQHQIQPMAWSPFSGGDLFGDAPRATRVRGVLERIASEQDSTIDAVALAWLLRLPTRPIPILGTQRIERIRSASRCFEIELSRQEWFEVYEASLGHEID